MNRREILKTTHKLLVALGGSSFFTIEELKALEASNDKPDLIWIHAMSCDGCSTSLLNSEVSVLDIITRFANVIFHPTIMAGTGENSLEILEKSKQKATKIASEKMKKVNKLIKG